MEDKNIINVRHVTKKYNLYNKPQDRFKEAMGFKKNSRCKEFYALNDVSFEVATGETVGIIGINGSGKSTLLKILTNVLSPSAGAVEVKGRVSALLELGAGFNQEYTGLENIYLNGRMMGYSRKEMDKKIQTIIEFADIGDFLYQPVKTYSSGMFARLAFSVAINVEPNILIVDEALSVGDIFFQNKCFKKFDELKQKGVTILFVSHDIQSVRQMCNRVLWLERGIVKEFGDASKICDMYMDAQRKDSEHISVHKKDSKIGDLFINEIDEERKYPVLEHEEDRFQNKDVKIKSVFFTDELGEYANTLYVDRIYNAHIVVECLANVEDLIVGVVFEDKKGLPLFDINNFINQQETVNGKKGYALEMKYEFKLPRIMNGVYLVGAAVAKGTQAKHEMLTWLHAVRQVEVINTGYNSSYIEIPSTISAFANKVENVFFV